MVDWSWWSIVNNSNLNISDLIQTCFHQPIVFISCKAYRCMMKQKEKCVLVGCVYLLSERKKSLVRLEKNAYYNYFDCSINYIMG